MDGVSQGVDNRLMAVKLCRECNEPADTEAALGGVTPRNCDWMTLAAVGLHRACHDLSTGATRLFKVGPSFCIRCWRHAA